MRFLLTALGALALAAAEPPPADAPPPAPALAPDATPEGYEPLPKGGAGGKVVEVTTLDDAGPGSLRAALEKLEEHTTISFKVGGTILAKRTLRVGVDHVTLDGSAAPAPGITISGRDLMKDLFDENGYLKEPIDKLGARLQRFEPGTMRTHRGPLLSLGLVDDVILRDIRFRGTPSRNIGVSNGSKNLLFDHISSTDCGDGAMFINDQCENVTVAWSLFAGCNLCIRARGRRVSFHHCLFAENALRHPLIRGDSLFDIRNCVIRGWRIAGIQTNPGEEGATRINLVNNFFGPSAIGKGVDRLIDAGPSTPLYLRGNVGPETQDVNGRSKVGAPHEEPRVTTQPAEEARDLVLRHAGARPRDEMDRGWADGSRKYVHINKDEWRLDNPWWVEEKKAREAKKAAEAKPPEKPADTKGPSPPAGKPEPPADTKIPAPGPSPAGASGGARRRGGRTGGLAGA